MAYNCLKMSKKTKKFDTSIDGKEYKQIHHKEWSKFIDAFLQGGKLHYTGGKNGSRDCSFDSLFGKLDFEIYVITLGLKTYSFYIKQHFASYNVGILLDGCRGILFR